MRINILKEDKRRPGTRDKQTRDSRIPFCQSPSRVDAFLRLVLPRYWCFHKEGPGVVCSLVCQYVPCTKESKQIVVPRLRVSMAEGAVVAVQYNTLFIFIPFK